MKICLPTVNIWLISKIWCHSSLGYSQLGVTIWHVDKLRFQKQMKPYEFRVNSLTISANKEHGYKKFWIQKKIHTLYLTSSCV